MLSFPDPLSNYMITDMFFAAKLVTDLNLDEDISSHFPKDVSDNQFRIEIIQNKYFKMYFNTKLKETHSTKANIIAISIRVRNL